VRSALVALLGVGCLASCSSGQTSTFALTSASVDPTYWCPGGANNTAYDVHATVDVHNGTSKVVTIDSATAEMKLISVKGNWLEKVGDRYTAGTVTYSPTSVGAGSSAPVTATIPSACTSGKYGAGASSYGDYDVTVHMTTSAGAFSITAKNQHRILAAG
jgi:hypothetical protein